MPHWLIILAWCCIAVAVVCALVIALDEARHPQHMAIMNVVWPITALYAGPLALWGYFTFGRMSTHAHMAMGDAADAGDHHRGQRMHKPFAAVVALAATHCGAGCTLGDLIGESIVAATGLTLAGKPMFAGWLVDFGIAYVLGIVFQYLTIAPMRHLGVGAGIKAAIKADTLSLLAWQIGMYAWMAIATFAIFGHELPKSSPVFWFMMQIAMLAGFATAYPVNAWLVRAGIKEKM